MTSTADEQTPVRPPFDPEIEPAIPAIRAMISR